MKKRGVGILALVAAVGVSLAAAVPASAAFPGANGLLAFDVDGNIYSSNPDGTHMVQLTTDGQSGDPAWSPSGKRIAFARRGFIFVMTQHGKWPRKVERLGHSSQPAWSANGKRMAFVHRGDIWLVSAAGGTPTRLTHDASFCVNDDQPAWSPLGGTIAFQQTVGTYNPVEGGCDVTSDNAVQIVLLRLKTGARHAITDAWDPNFTGDGRGLVFQSDQDPDDPAPASLGASQYESSNLTGEPRLFYSRTWCAEGAPCLTDVVAAPTSTLANPQGVYVETLEGAEPGIFGGFCVNSASSVDGPSGGGNVAAGFCRFDGSMIDQLDWQPTRP